MLGYSSLKPMTVAPTNISVWDLGSYPTFSTSALTDSYFFSYRLIHQTTNAAIKPMKGKINTDDIVKTFACKVDKLIRRLFGSLGRIERGVWSCWLNQVTEFRNTSPFNCC